tara:strand:- start:136 stop:1827 length:1692 start_codon:yes stop_codon:yes gene_type:complete
MNPIGLVLVALVGAIKFVSEALSGSEGASNKLAQGFAYLGGFIQPLKDGVVSAFGFIVDAIKKPGEAFDSMINGIETAVNYWRDNILAPYLSAWKLLGLGVFKQITKIRLAWNNLTGDVEESKELETKLKEIEDNITENQKVITDAANTIKNDVVDAVESVVEGVSEYVKAADILGDKLSALVKEEQRLVNVRREQELQNARSLADIEKLKVIRDDEAQSLQDRIKANEEIGVIEKARVTAAIALAEAELSTTRRNMALKGRSTELLDLEKDKLIEIQELRSENAGIENEQVVNNTALRKEQFDKEVQLIDAKRDLNAVLEEDAVKLIDAVIKAEEDKLIKLRELGLEENQIYRDIQGSLALSRQEAIKVRLDAEKEAADIKSKLDKENADKTVKLATETAKQRADVERELGSQLKNFSSSLVEALGADSKKGAAIQKATALAEIAVDTARAISSLVAASSANPLNAVTAGGAGAIQFTSGLLQIGSNIASAYALLKAPTPQVSDASGSSPSTQQTAPDLGFEGRSSGSENFGAQVIRAYVTESDITTSQSTASNIQELSQIG